jgi:hypothetical protein
MSLDNPDEVFVPSEGDIDDIFLDDIEAFDCGIECLAVA